MRTLLGISRALVSAVALVTASSAFAADGGIWSVSKSSGEVWMGSGEVQQASLKSDDVLKPGDTIRTGRNGRVLLVRGEESIMIAPNSVVGLPAEKKEGLSTTIMQKAGSILLEVEKKNVKHFEVETPYLAAVVKGTQFKVTVTAKGTTVNVSHGQVEVSDFKTGQIAQVMPGQHATVFAHGNAGLSLGGSGTLQPIEQGKPRAVDRVPASRASVSGPGKHGSASLTPQKQGASAPRHGVTRISGALGEVKLNVHKVTHGLARNPNVNSGSRSADRNNSTVWSSGDTASADNSSGGNNKGNGHGNGNNGAANNAVNSAGNSVASTVAAVVGSGVGNGNGNNGNGNGNGGGNGSNAGGNGNGNNKNANAGGGNGNSGQGNGGGNGNSGQGNGGGNGNGNAFGKNK